MIPSWAKDLKIGNQCINAKAETVAEKPSFRSAFKKRRCLVIADGFYEWPVQGAHQQPMWIGLTSTQPLAFAGLWEHGQPAEWEARDTCTILTTEPNDLMATIHNHVPVILSSASYDQWLDPTLQQVESLTALLRSYPSEELLAYPVRTLVNNPAPQCLETVLFWTTLRPYFSRGPSMTTIIDAIYVPELSTRYALPIFLGRLPTGFPSPADDYLEGKLDLNRHLVKHPAATFFVRVTGDSMFGAGIHSGDLLVVDRALEPEDKHVGVAVLDGELTVKRLFKQNGIVRLLPENLNYPPLEIIPQQTIEVWGVVTSVIHAL